ncbi:muscle M-line assembly protein unc-89-like isoform X2 [Pseudoliparis swirei]|uniref:muscle M-line assembly protein unc-89-like isoform X2 n=1 Tax=Pseudoliparis swirei TaxID=2059687 RepID=UPI0024BD9655|nr:muscle M-line assembly protein unc-89-like isoform X2 [Pseudoliparis swirei]
MESKVTTELSNRNHLPGGNKQWKGEVRTSDHQSTPQTGSTHGCPHEVRTAAGLEDHVEVRRGDVNQRKVPEETVGELDSSTKKMEVLRVPSVQKEKDLSGESSDPVNEEVVGQMCCPASADKKVKCTTIVTLHNVVHGLPSEKKSNVTVVLTLEKEHSPEDRGIEFQQDRSLSPGQEGEASSPVLRPPPSLTDSSKLDQQATPQVSGDPSQYTGEGSSMSPPIWDDSIQFNSVYLYSPISQITNECPPPTMGTISKTRSPRVRTESRDAGKWDSDLQTGDEPTYQAYDNQAFQDSDDSDKTPIIVFLDEPVDIQSACKRLSTILECEEDLDGIVSPEHILDEEETKPDEEKQNMRTISMTEINTVVDMKDTGGKGHDVLRTHNHILSADSVSIPKKRDQGTPDSSRPPETKRKFKFKFPKNKLAAISQAIRLRTTRTGKKTLKVVVYEEEEDKASDSKPVKETKKPTQESKRVKTSSTTQLNVGEDNARDRDIKVSPSIDTRPSKSGSRLEKLCRSTLDSMDSLEESIKQLEISVDSVSGPSSPSSEVSSPPASPDSSCDSRDRTQLQGKVKRERKTSPSKRPASQTLKGPDPPQSKRAKPQATQDSGKTSTKKQTSSSSSGSSAQQPHSRSRDSPSSRSPEKTPEGQKQAGQPPRLVVIPR